jgi:hypothetical protein
MARIVVRPLDDVLRRFGNQIGAVGSARGRKALALAVNRVTTTIHGRVIKAIRKQSDIPTAIIRKQVKRKLAAHQASTAIEGVIWATGAPISLKYFKAKQFSFGVRTKERGAWQRYPSAFMGPRPGVIAKRLGGHVFIRTSAARNPIEKLVGTSVPEELVRDESERVFRETVETMLPSRVAHELARLMPG